MGRWAGKHAGGWAALQAGRREGGWVEAIMMAMAMSTTVVRNGVSEISKRPLPHQTTGLPMKAEQEWSFVTGKGLCGT